MTTSRLFLATSCLCLTVNAGQAQEFGALLDLSYGKQKFSGVVESNDDDEYQSANESVFVGSLSAGLSFSGFGVQVDRVIDSSGDPGADEGGFSARSTTLHANYRTGAYAFGLFYGVGDNLPPVDGDDGEVTYKGIEVAANFGDYRIAGQVGSATHRNDHSSLDYDNKVYAVVEGQYYLDNGLTISGNLGHGSGLIHDDKLSVTQIGLGVSKAMGASGLVGTVGLRHTMASDGDNGNLEGKGNNTELLLGLTMPLGGATVREVNESSVSMIRTNLPAIIASMTAVYD